MLLVLVFNAYHAGFIMYYKQDFSCLHVHTSNTSQMSMMSGLFGDINALCFAMDINITVGCNKPCL